MDESLRIANEYAKHTLLHPIVAVLLAVLVALTLIRSRNYAVASFLIIINFVTAAQRISVAGIDFPIYRIMICVILLRAFLRNEYKWVRMTKLDGIVILQVFAASVATVLRHSAISEFVYAVSTALDALGTYYAFRVLLRDYNDLKLFARTLAYISFGIALIFVVERSTGRNPMAVFGGVSEFSWIREGKARVQGPYPHVILAGCYWAMIAPFFIAGWREGQAFRPVMAAAFLAAAITVLLCASSTPLVSLAAGIGAMILYYQRNITMRLKVAILAAILGLALFWNKPVWFLLAKIDFTGGSTGYFRYFLIDSFVRNWKQWVLIGTRTTANWGQGLIDVCNQYVAMGTTGGLATFALFLASIACALEIRGFARTPGDR